MSTITRNLSNIDGANVTNPDANAFTATALEAFANDAAFEAVHTAQAGSIYWNSTDKAVRQYNGTAWQYDKTIMSVQIDAASTGSAQDITPNTVDQVIRFTSGTLTSIRSLVAGNQKTVFLVNDQAINLAIQNQAVSATAANRIITGTGADIILRAGRTATLLYDEDLTRWRVTASDWQTGALQSYANDAAYVAATPAITGAIYWNTTEQCVRQYNGTDWQYDKTMYATQTDNTTTGSNQDITPASSQLIRFTQGSLASIRSIVPGLQTVMNFVNGQASQNITIVNESAGASATSRIVTGTGTDFVLKPGAAVGFIYDSVGLRWRLASGGGGGGLQPNTKTANFAAEAGNNYLTDTSGGAIVATLPSGTDGATIRFVDATESWGTNNLTITPASGQIIDMLAADETLVCDVVRGWVELSWNGTRWAFSSLASTTVGVATASTAGIVSATTQSFGGNKTFVGTITPSGGIVGKTDGVPVAVGNVGENQTAVVSAAASISVSNVSFLEISSATRLTLTAGNWLIMTTGYGYMTQSGLSATGGITGDIQFWNATDSVEITSADEAFLQYGTSATLFHLSNQDAAVNLKAFLNITGTKVIHLRARYQLLSGTVTTVNIGLRPKAGCIAVRIP